VHRTDRSAAAPRIAPGAISRRRQPNFSSRWARVIARLERDGGLSPLDKLNVCAAATARCAGYQRDIALAARVAGRQRSAAPGDGAHSPGYSAKIILLAAVRFRRAPAAALVESLIA